MNSLRRVFTNLYEYWFFILTIFISAFLLFQIQPLIGKYVSPWFGGGSAVWTTCMLFFQVFLLGGYTYAHLMNKLNLRTQAKLHTVIILGSLVLIISLSFVWETPVTPDSSWKPPSSNFPIWYVLRLLIVGVGLPFFLLSTTSSLIQAWFSQIHHSRSPYSFYAVSNVASLFALISYPVLFEPFLALKGQARLWSLVYVVFALILIYSAIQIIKSAGPKIEIEKKKNPKVKKKKKRKRSQPIQSTKPSDKPNWRTYLLWISLAACASTMLLTIARPRPVPRPSPIAPV